MADEKPITKEALRLLRQQFNVSNYGTNIPNVDDVAKLKKLQEDSRIAEERKRAGGTIQQTGLSPTGQPEDTMGMSRNEKFFSEGRALDKAQLGGFKSFGDKADFEIKNKLRAFKGEQRLYANPSEFMSDVDKSLALGDKSAMNTPEGRARAISAGVQSGLSYDAAAKSVQDAFDSLGAVRKKEGEMSKGAAVTPTGIPPLLQRPAETPPSGATPSAPSDQTPVQATKPEQSFVGEVYDTAKPVVTATGIAAGGGVLTKGAKLLETLPKVGKYLGPLAKGVGKLALPAAIALEAVDAGRFIFDKDARDKMIADTEDAARDAVSVGGIEFSPQVAMDAALNPTKNILSIGALAKDALVSDTNAKQSAADLDTMQRLTDRIRNERRMKYSDAEFAKLDPKERQKYMFNLRKKFTIAK